MAAAASSSRAALGVVSRSSLRRIAGDPLSRAVLPRRAMHAVPSIHPFRTQTVSLLGKDATSSGARCLRQMYATSAFTNAQPRNHSASTQAAPPEENSSSSSSEQPDPDEPPPKASIRERLRFLMRRYGWWALGVYLLASTADFSLTFLAIHMMGADHIRELEDRVRNYLGMGKREMEDAEVAAWPVPVIAGGELPEGVLPNNAEAAKRALESVSGQKSVGPEKEQQKKKKSNQGTLWTEAVLAYTIHKTLLLPFRVGITAAVTPSFVKYMVRLGWARNNAAVQQAAKKAKLARQAKQTAK